MKQYMSATDCRWAIRNDVIEGCIHLSDVAYLRAVFSFKDTKAT